LTPNLILILVVVAPIILIIGLGISTAAGMYFLDRGLQVGSERGAAQKNEPPRRLIKRAAGPQPLRLSTVSQMVTADGAVEAAPSLSLDNTKLGMWIFLASEIMFFSALIMTFLVYKIRGLMDAGGVLNIPLSALNTFILIVSSFTVVMALEAIREDRQTRFQLLLLGTLALGATFIGIQGTEWNELFQQGIFPNTSLFGTAFFVLTGFHGLHVLGGLAWLTITLLRAFQGDFTRVKNRGIEMFGLYWHFVDIVWIVLFTIIYLI
jgi:heme/copper-type cytochrome/quinol oxidase subunit 3